MFIQNNNGTWDYDQLIVASRISESHYHTKAKIYNNKIYTNSINTSIDVVGTDGTIDSVGSVTVYSKNGNKWLHEKVLHRNDSDDHNGQSVDYFGRLFDVYEGGIAITSERAEHSDNTIVEAGKVYIFNNSYSSTGENGGDGEDGGDNLISAAICFLGHVLVETDQGKIQIKNITSKNTIYGNKVVGVVKVKNKDNYMILFKKEFIGNKMYHLWIHMYQRIINIYKRILYKSR